MNPAFHCEWYTTGDDLHRVQITHRDGFPTAFDRELCNRVARLIGADARLARLEHDPYQGIILHIGTTDPRKFSSGFADGINRTLVQDPRLEGSCRVDLYLIPRGNEEHDRYNHMDHIAVNVLDMDNSMPMISSRV
jgi:hypothetical protein